MSTASPDSFVKTKEIPELFLNTPDLLDEKENKDPFARKMNNFQKHFSKSLTTCFRLSVKWLT